METVVKKLYEAMFLIDSARAADWDGTVAGIKDILERADAEIVSIEKWGERKLAYEINGKSRGTYILCYFRVEGRSIGDIERDVRLSEQIMRVLILCAGHLAPAGHGPTPDEGGSAESEQTDSSGRSAPPQLEEKG